ncbi:restriction endonuclease [Patescibacteria group bacterium]|nr:restriction endonuclease [Patescibacteria group bacterium]MBU4578674.1 restriction endonuclease [Patescibacteria group bacterium]MCG2701808.1 restriction endonuclease [Candidatus Parcubacteria bacterium]
MAYFEKHITNQKTGETKLIKSNDATTFNSKVQRQFEVWDRLNQRLDQQAEKEHSISEAQRQTKEATKTIEDCNNILKYTLKIDDKINWEELQDNKLFQKYKAISEPVKKEVKNSFFEIIPYLKKKKDIDRNKAEEQYQKDLQKYKKTEKKLKSEYEKEKAEFLKKQNQFNASLESNKQKYEKGEVEGVKKYVGMVMERSKYPEVISVFPEVNYEPNAKVALVDMELPSDKQVPSVKEYKYVTSRKEIDEIKMGLKEFEAFYNNLIFQICLRTIHEVFEADYAKVVEVVVFNGWVQGIDGRTGKEFNNCIVSLQVTRDEFGEINLEMINPRDCFQHLKGVSAGSLINLSPIKPIMEMNQEDKRFIVADNVLDSLDKSTNLAIMDWQKFEVLVRDLIKKEFSREGCKVEVTQASRDQGVDAIAFDEDPIRGGKYIIQAKRYNNLVPVSAVRDLYGTVHAEGAVKGILITTSYYGPEALNFVKDKPLKLINGEELIYMFNKHGYNYKIELTKKQKAASSLTY